MTEDQAAKAARPVEGGLREALMTIRDVAEWSRVNGEPLFDDDTLATLDAALAIEAEDAAPRSGEGLDKERLMQAMRAVLDTTTRERVLPYTAMIAAEYDGLSNTHAETWIERARKSAARLRENIDAE